MVHLPLCTFTAVQRGKKFVMWNRPESNAVHSFKIFCIIFCSKFSPSKWLSFRLSNKIFVSRIYSVYAVSPDFLTISVEPLNKYSAKIGNCLCPLIQFNQLPCYFILNRIKYSPQKCFLISISLVSSTNQVDAVVMSRLSKVVCDWRDVGVWIGNWIGHMQFLIAIHILTLLHFKVHYSTHLVYSVCCPSTSPLVSPSNGGRSPS